ncbi:carboxypeptidase-like regulatory domain-containing protein [Tenacibaculum salmonis]|uniref:carboxypeptidase-like regulatory domain-containing protein n=1 Tax=Tenacibaculum sp. P3-BQ1 TaxID=3232310 RepID=UPI0034DE4D14
MKKQLLLFFLVFGVITISVSQEHQKFLYANVKDNIGSVYNAHVINLTTKQGTFTNENGEFRILAKKNDSLKISFVGYKSTIIIVASNHFGMQKNTFKLIKTTYELSEVNIKKHNLSGFLSTDSKNIKTTNQINATTLNLPYAGSKQLTPAERTLQTAMGGSNAFTFGLLNKISLDYIVNKASGRIKKLKKLKAIETLEVKVTKIKNNYSSAIVQEYHIKKSDIYKFIYYCTSDEKFEETYNSGEINIILFLKKKAEVFKKLNLNDYK